MDILRVIVSLLVDEDLELLQRWRDGDRSAGQQLARRHYRVIFKRVRREIGGDENLAADITQQVFEIVVSKRDDVVEDFGRYLHGITRFRLWEHFRGKRKPTDPAVSILQDPSHGLSSVMVRQEDARLLVKALSTLSLEEQVYVMWTYADRLTYPEIAERVGLTTAQINGRVHRAREKLRTRMAEMARSTSQRESLSKGFETWMVSLRRRANEEHQ